MDSLKAVNSIMDSIKEQPDSLQLPERLRDSCHFNDFLKQSPDKEIYQLLDDKEHPYILKRGTDRQLALIKQEYQLFKNLEAIPNLAIPKCVEYWEDGKYCYLLRHYIEGLSLSEYFEKQMYFTNLQIVEYMLEICHIIQILHSQNPPIIHRDIKPENFILERGTGTLYLIDLDSARQFTPDKSRDTQLMGTPSHAAPEQFGFSQSDVRTDIYALGKTMLYLATGTTEDKNLSTPSLAAPIRKIIERCISFAPEQRYPDIRALIKDLKKYKRKLVHQTTLVRKVTTVCLILLAGIVGYISGIYRATMQNPISNSANLPDMTQNSSDILNIDEVSAEDSIEAQNLGTPLSKQTDYIPFDFAKYRDAVNQIVLDYYNEDPDALTLHCEALIAALYKDEALTRIPGTDYAGRDMITKEEMAEPNTGWLRNALAYRDQMLYKRLGSYSKYKNYIFSYLDGMLNPTTQPASEPKAELYYYANCTGSEADEHYSAAFVDIVYAVKNSFDGADSYPTPREESD